MTTNSSPKGDGKKEKGGGFLRETISTVLWALGIALVLRTFLFQPFHIPSGSMYPGLREGDYIITTKYSVGYGRYAAAPIPFPKKKGRLFERAPKRGDVLVFRPDGANINFIKRLVGLPGDQIQVKQGQVYINGNRVPTEKTGEAVYSGADRDYTAEIWSETFGNGVSHLVYNTQQNGPRDNTTVQTVPSGYYFMMGDNRDHSLDSRVSVGAGGAGYVPAENIMGRAEFVLLSVDEDFDLRRPWTWGNMRGDRFFKAIN